MKLNKLLVMIMKNNQNKIQLMLLNKIIIIPYKINLFAGKEELAL